MCGILLHCTADHTEPIPEGISSLLKNRGPDSSNLIHRKVGGDNDHAENPNSEQLKLTFFSTVLALRGNTLVSQPLTDASSGSVFCWNGEAWRLGKDPIEGNDSSAIFKAIIGEMEQSYKKDQFSQSLRESIVSALKKVLGSTQGPFAFLFYHPASRLVFFGRDDLGRRSLLVRYTQASFTLSSVSDPSTLDMWHEVNVGGFYELSMDQIATNLKLSDAATSVLGTGREAAQPTLHSWSGIERVLNLESTHDCIDETRSNAWQTRQILNRAKFDSELAHNHHQLQTPVEELYKQLHQSLSLRLTGLPKLSEPGTSPLAILFSGGLDCTVVARICDDILSPGISIDLLNVAFENPRVLAAARTRKEPPLDQDESGFSSCPDRITGLASYQELTKACPKRQWRFFNIDIPYHEVLTHRAQVLTLMHPHNTEMDLSIALALYFASRGIGQLTTCAGRRDYISKSLVLLSGLGADELFAGYARHERAYVRGQDIALLDELDLDFGRIGKRNLGRDDRIISHWGKEVRYPYLDEDLTSWALSKPSWDKLNLAALGPSTSVLPGPKFHNVNKIILRRLALSLGLVQAADEQKRAIQFGARTAKMQDGRAKGTEAVKVQLSKLPVSDDR